MIAYRVHVYTRASIIGLHHRIRIQIRLMEYPPSLELDACCMCRECSSSTSKVDRRTTLAATNVLFGFSSRQLVAVDRCLGCLAPRPHHSYLCSGVPSRTVTSRRHSSSARARRRGAVPPAIVAGGVGARCLADFGDDFHRRRRRLPPASVTFSAKKNMREMHKY